MLGPPGNCVWKEKVAFQRFVKLFVSVDCSVLESAFGEVRGANCGEEGMRVRKHFSKKVVERLLNRVICRRKLRRKTKTLSLNGTHE